jgi:hypothetical protein
MKDPTAKHILVIGDWVVDEHWLVGDQRATFSSRTGNHHQLAITSPRASIRHLGGAGQVAALLGQVQFRLPDDTSRQLTLHGVGRWHSADEPAIHRLLDPSTAREQTNYRLTIDTTNAPPSNITLHNLITPSATDERFVGTTRVTRIYGRVGDAFELLRRVDWELEYDRWAPREVLGRVDKEVLTQALDQVPGRIDVIVVKDLLKGVMSRTIVRLLDERYPNAEWYIASKAWMPYWLDEKQDNKIDERIRAIHEKIRLFLIPPTAANHAVRSAGWSSAGWITRRGAPYRDAIEQINTLGKRYPHARIVVLPKDITALIGPSFGVANGQYGFVQASDDALKEGALRYRRFVTMASVLYPVLIGHMMALGDAQSFESLVDRALWFTRHWMLKECERFSQFSTFVPTAAQRCVVHSDKTECVGPEPDVRRIPKLERFDWNGALKSWSNAFSGYGIVEDIPDKPKIQLWRAMTDIDGYVACVPQKRRILRQLVKLSERFRRSPTQMNTSIMVIDSPGSGKSYLMKCLARLLGMRHLEFNITQLLSRPELVHCFDTIVTTQALNPDEPLLVFFDEINAKIQGEHVYDAFLSPLEQGSYIRAGNRFHIQPCLWLFAGTEKPRTSREGQQDRSDKGSDLLSRLTVPPCELNIDQTPVGTNDEQQDIRELAIIEKIYIAVVAIRSEFTDVAHVSENVLKVFRDLKPDVQARGIRNFVRQFQDVQRGRVTSRNLPPNWRDWTNFPQDATPFEPGSSRLVEIEV